MSRKDDEAELEYLRGELKKIQERIHQVQLKIAETDHAERTAQIEEIKAKIDAWNRYSRSQMAEFDLLLAKMRNRS